VNAAVVAAEAKRNPLAVELAAAASLAARVEPELVRHLRRELVREAPVSVEADLWFGPLVSSRSAESIVLATGSLAALRARVPRDQVPRVAALIAEVHRDAPPLLRLEETLIADLLLGKPDAVIEASLQKVLGSIAREPARRRGLAAWAWSALPRLPLGDRRLPTVGTLSVATGLAMRTALPAAAVTVPGALDAIPADLVVDRTIDLEVQRRNGQLLLSHADDATPRQRRISVPDTVPRFVEVEVDGNAHLVAIPRDGRAAPIQVDDGEVRLRCLGHRAWEVVGSDPEPEPRVDRGLIAEIVYIPTYDAFGWRPPDLTAADLVLVGAADRRAIPIAVDHTILAVPGPAYGRFPTTSKGQSEVSTDPDELAQAVMTHRGASYEEVERAFQGSAGLLDAGGDRRLTVTPGRFPGCFRATLRGHDGRTVGIVGLNTWYLSPALIGDTVPDVDDRLLGDGLAAWCAEHDVTILLMGATPDRLRDARRLHFDHAIARRGTFDLVIGPRASVAERNQGQPLAVVKQHLEVTADPANASIALRLVVHGDELHVELRPYALEAGAIEPDPSFRDVGRKGHASYQLPFRRRWPVPALSYQTARDLYAHLSTNKHVVMTGPPDAALDDITRIVAANLQRDGYSPIETEIERYELVTSLAARVPRPVLFLTADARSSATLPVSHDEASCIRVPGLSRTEGEALARRLEAPMIVARDWTRDEALVRLGTSYSERQIEAAFASSAGAPQVTLDLLAGISEREMVARYPVPGAELLAEYRRIVDDLSASAPASDALVATGLVSAETGGCRSAWHREHFGHAWLDQQFVRLGHVTREPTWVLMVGSSATEIAFAAKLGELRDYGLVVWEWRPRGTDQTARAFVQALPPHLERRLRLRARVSGAESKVSVLQRERYGIARATQPPLELDGIVVVVAGDRTGDQVARLANTRGRPVLQLQLEHEASNEVDRVIKILEIMNAAR
jgi:hypothetical protein